MGRETMDARRKAGFSTFQAMKEPVQLQRRDVAVHAIEGAPEVGDESMGVVQHRRLLRPLPDVRALLKPEPRRLGARRHPRERDVRDNVVVIIESADIAVAPVPSKKRQRFIHWIAGSG